MRNMFSPSFPHGLFYLLIPQTVDQGIQHGDHCVEHRHYFNLVRWMALLWYDDINKCNCPIKQGDCGEVRGTGGEGLVPALSRAHPEDGVKDIEVWNNDDEQGDDDDGACWDGRRHFSHVNMGTSTSGGRSQKKWLTSFGPQKVRLNKYLVNDEEFTHPPT